MSERLAAKPALEVPSSAELLDTLINMPGSVGSTYNRFYNYSPRNIAFLAMQGAPAEPVATFKKWQEMNRQVQRGEKAYSILRPIQVKIPGEEVAGIKVEDDKMIRRFKVVRALFAASQTLGEELPPYEPPAFDVDRVMQVREIERGPYQSYNGNLGGYAVGRTVAINPVAPYPLRTTLHEISHVEHGHTTDENMALYQEHRGTFEFEAEASAFVVLKQIDQLDDQVATVSRGYIQHWLADERPSEASLKRVLNVASTIIKAGYEEAGE